MESGGHRDPTAEGVGEGELAARAAEDAQDAELVRVAAYSGLRRGELMTLRWRDVRFLGPQAIVSRTLSADVEADSPKAAASARSPSPTRPPPPSIASAAGPTTSDPTSTSSATASAAAWTRQPCGAATSAPATPPSFPLCASTICATPTAPSWSPAASTSSRQERDGPRQHRDHRAVPARPACNRTRRPLHAGIPRRGHRSAKRPRTSVAS